MSWSTPTDPDNAARRAGGRRRYHKQRQTARAARRFDLVLLLARYPFGYGLQALLARELGVSEATISRDMAALGHNWTQEAPRQRERQQQRDQRLGRRVAQWEAEEAATARQEARQQAEHERTIEALASLDSDALLAIHDGAWGP